MTTLLYGVVGCGMMGREHIRNIQLLQNTEIAAVYEPNMAMQREAKKLAPNATFVDSLAQLLALKNIDCVVIASPNFLHASQLHEIASIRDSLPLLIEKPLCTSTTDEPLIKELMRDYAAPIWVAMEYRYMPPMAEFLKQADTATGGVSMLTIREHRYPFLDKVGNWNRFNRYSGGTLVEKCCHYFDLMRLIIRSEPCRIMASASQTHNHVDEQYDGVPADIWDSAYVIVDFDNGSRAMLELCMFAEGSRFQEEISAVGVNGKIECLIPGPSRFWNSDLGPEPTSKVITSPRSPAGPVELEVPVDPALLEAGDHHGSTYYQHQKFQRVVMGQAEPEVTLGDGWLAVKMGMAAQESAATGSAIEV